MEWASSRRGNIGVSLSGGERNHLFLNLGGRHFEDVSGVSGLDTPADSRGFAILDFDRDGWQDIALVNTNAPLLNLYRNQSGEIGGAGGKVIALRFVGGNHADAPSEGASNRDGFGAQVTISLGDLGLVREHRAGEGFATQNSATMIVGIGERDAAERVSVRWPSGVVQEARDVPAGTLLVVNEKPGESQTGVAFARESYARPPGSVPVLVADAETLELGVGKRDPEDGAPLLRMYTTMATWCPACKRNIPQVKLVRDAFGEGELGVFGVPIDPEDAPAKLAAYVEEYDPGYELLTDLPRHEIDRVQSMVGAEFGQEVLPAAVLTDADGRVLELVAGIPTISQVRRLLRERDGDGRAGEPLSGGGGP